MQKKLQCQRNADNKQYRLIITKQGNGKMSRQYEVTERRTNTDNFRKADKRMFELMEQELDVPDIDFDSWADDLIIPDIALSVTAESEKGARK